MANITHNITTALRSERTQWCCLISALAISLPGSAYAQAVPTDAVEAAGRQKSTTSEPVPDVKRTRQTMEDKRANDSTAISAGFGVYRANGVGVGLQFGVYLSPNTLLEGDLFTGVAFRGPMLSAGTGSVSLGARHFVTDTLYLRGAGRYRSLVSYWSYPDGPYERTYDTDQTDLGIDLAFGNRCQWGIFTFGVEWVGVHVPVAILTSDCRSDWHWTETSCRTSRLPDARFLNVQLGVSYQHAHR